jgi:hypothetical protein
MYPARYNKTILIPHCRDYFLWIYLFCTSIVSINKRLHSEAEQSRSEITGKFIIGVGL